MRGRASSHFFAFLSAVAFSTALLILALFLWQAESLVRFGLDGKLYYLILVPLGVAVASCLFGVMQSNAVYNGRVLGGTLKLGGPIVAFVLVLILGFWLAPNPSSFNVTVVVHRTDVPTQPFMRGKVMLRLGGDARTATISDQGVAHFVGIPTMFRNQSVVAQLVDAVGYEAVEREINLSGDGIQLAVQPTPVVFRGQVRTLSGLPVPGAKVSLAGRLVHTDIEGYFSLPVPGMQPESDAIINVDAPGYLPWSSHVVPLGNDLIAMLKKSG